MGKDHQVLDFPANPMQQGMFALHQQSPHSLIHNCQRIFSWAVDSSIVPIFTASLEELVRQHPFLKASFFLTDEGHVRQRWHADRAADIRLLSIVDTADEAAEISGLADAELRRPFDMAEDPLIRFLWCVTPQRLYLCITYHHILIDGWSFQQLTEDFQALFTSAARGEAYPVLDRTGHEAYFEWLESVDSAESLDFWRDYLQGLEQPCRAPQLQNAVVPKKALVGFDQIIDVETTNRLKAFCSARRITLNMLLQVAWGLTLSRLNNQNDVVFGSVVSGRPPEVEGVETLLGLFINTVPVRIRLAGHETVEDLLRTHREASLSQMAHHHVPLDEVQRVAPVSRGLINHLLAFESYPMAAVRQDTLDSGSAKASRLYLPYPLSINVYPGEDTGICWYYDEDSYDEAQIALFADAFQQMLLQMEADPNQAACLVPLRLQDIASPPLLPSSPLLERLERAFDQFRDEPALSDDAGPLTYGELQERAAALAGRLYESGLREGDRVGLWFEPGRDMMAALLACLTSGITYVPLDPRWPPARRGFVVYDSDCSAILSGGAYPDDVAIPVIPMRGVTYSGNAVPTVSDPQRLAYLIYTSGSTGQPKGCMVTHRNLAALFGGMEHEFGFRPGDKWVMSSSFAFDFSVWEMFACWLTGGQLFLPSRELVRNVASFRIYLAENEITVLNQTPSAFLALAEHELSQSAALQKIRTVLFGGDKLYPSALQEWVERYPLSSTRLYNAYGITETTVHSTLHEITADDIKAEGKSPIGTAIPGYRLYVLDQWGNRVAPGTRGEIFVGGEGVSHGYWKRSELTASRYLPDRFRGAGTMYRSGDLARLRRDGGLEYLRRVDRQVQLRGYRIELDEITRVALSMDGVNHAFTRHDPTRQRLELFVEAKGSTEDAIRSHLAGLLPEYAVPSVIMPIKAMPLNANGKPDADLLALWAQDRREAVSQQWQPEGQDLALAEHWRNVVGRAVHSPSDDFFQSGGTSLLVIRLASEIRKQLGIEVPVGALFEEPTFAKLSVLVHSHSKTQSILEDDVMVWNAHRRQAACFLFPPAIGYAFGFARLAQELPCRTVGLNFPLSDDPVKALADIVEANWEEGNPHLFVGFSAGGGLAHQTALELGRRGKSVDAFIFLDCRRLTETEPVDETTMDRIVQEYVSHPLAKPHLTDPHLRAAMERRIRASTFFLHHTPIQGRTNGDLHQISSEPTRDDRARFEAWDPVIEGRHFFHSGFGPHAFMLDDPHFRPNADLVRRVIDGYLPQAPFSIR